MKIKTKHKAFRPLYTHAKHNTTEASAYVLMPNGLGLQSCG